MAKLKKRFLGKTDIEITPIGLGVMQFAGGRGVFRVMYSGITQETMTAIIKAALDGGINWFDTAEMYGNGRSEQGLVAALKTLDRSDADVHIATKWWPLLRTAGNIGKTINKRQQMLTGYTIDLYQIHQPYSFSSVEAEMHAMADLADAGKIRSIGVSNFDADKMHRAHAVLTERGYPLAANQVQFNLIDRSIERDGILAAAIELGVTIIAYSPLASGLLSGKFHQNPAMINKVPRGRRMMLNRQIDKSRPLINALSEIGQRYDATPGQIALNWTVNFHGETVVAIPGASKPQHAAQNAGVMGFRLTEDEMAKINELSRVETI